MQRSILFSLHSGGKLDEKMNTTIRLFAKKDNSKKRSKYSFKWITSNGCAIRGFPNNMLWIFIHFGITWAWLIIKVTSYWPHDNLSFHESLTVNGKNLIGKSNISMILCCTYLGVCVCVTHCLKGLEDAVEEKVPDDFSILKGRNVPYEEVGKNSQRGGEHDPSYRQKKERGDNNNISGWKRDPTRAWNTLTL